MMLSLKSVPPSASDARKQRPRLGGWTTGSTCKHGRRSLAAATEDLQVLRRLQGPQSALRTYVLQTYDYPRN